jgi:hypothetical protein
VSVIYLEPHLRSPKHFMSIKHKETKMRKDLTHCPTALTHGSEGIFNAIICSSDEDSLWHKVRHGAQKVNTWSSGHVSGETGRQLWPDGGRGSNPQQGGWVKWSE